MRVPLLPGVTLPADPHAPDTVNRMGRQQLRTDEQYDGERFADAVFDQATARNSLFLDCSFAGVSFSDCNLRKCRFTDTAMREVRIVGTDLAETGWQDVTLTGCALAGVQAYSAGWRRVVFRDGKLDSVNFRGGMLTDVRFENCLLRDPDFSHATLLRVSFGGCTVTGADFTKTTCTDVDLRGASLDIAAGFDALRGTTIDSVQLVTLAPQLANHLGITVED
jgi:uncharacterized protein YjbI with pentapeptide repeats